MALGSGLLVKVTATSKVLASVSSVGSWLGEALESFCGGLRVLLA